MKTKTLIVTGKNFIARATMVKVDGRWFVLQSDPSIRWIRPWLECSPELLPKILKRNNMTYSWEQSNDASS
jgi:hypothetical protein